MNEHRSPLPVVSIAGLHLDSLGHYLAALGTLEIAARQWPTVRGAFAKDGFCLVGGPKTRDELVDLALQLASTTAAGKPGLRTYKRDWMTSQGLDTKAGDSKNVALYRSQCSEEECDLVDAHLLPANRLCFNPVLGTGGNSGRRDFANGWRDALSAVSSRSEAVRDDLARFLDGATGSLLGSWNGGSWFSQAISPWAMLFACEGLPLLAGKVSRRLGANTRREGAFPFTTAAAAPLHEKETDRVLAEVWAPVFRRPLALSEVATLFARGRAEVRRAGAVSPAAFSAAILQRGVDAGIAEFRRFLLTRTTSSQTFESTLSRIIEVKASPARAEAQAVEVAVLLRDALPADDSKVFRGLRGPIDEALVNLAALPDVPDAAWELLDALWDSLVRVDRNKAYRSKKPRFQLLPSSWLNELFRLEPPDEAAIVAMALASLQPAKLQDADLQSFLPYRLGVVPSRWRGDRFEIPKEAPAGRVWTGGELARDMGRVLRRRLLDVDGAHSPFHGTMKAPLSTVLSFLRGDLDDAAVDRWLGRMCLFDWREPIEQPRSEQSAPPPVDGVSSLYGFFKPLFYPWSPGRADRQPFLEAGSNALRPAALSRIAALLDAGDIESALEEARARYRSAGKFPLDLAAPVSLADPSRLLAALLIPTSSAPIQIARRWLVPERKENHA